VNMLQLKDHVVKGRADLGIAFDGEGDRMVVADSKGVQISGDELMVIFARDFLRLNPGETVMSEVKAIQFCYDDVASLGGKSLMRKIGHTHQEARMPSAGIQLYLKLYRYNGNFRC